MARFAVGLSLVLSLTRSRQHITWLISFARPHDQPTSPSAIDHFGDA